MIFCSQAWYGLHEARRRFIICFNFWSIISNGVGWCYRCVRSIQALWESRYKIRSRRESFSGEAGSHSTNLSILKISAGTSITSGYEYSQTVICDPISQNCSYVRYRFHNFCTAVDSFTCTYHSILAIAPETGSQLITYYHSNIWNSLIALNCHNICWLKTVCSSILICWPWQVLFSINVFDCLLLLVKQKLFYLMIAVCISVAEGLWIESYCEQRLKAASTTSQWSSQSQTSH